MPQTLQEFTRPLHQTNQLQPNNKHTNPPTSWYKDDSKRLEMAI